MEPTAFDELAETLEKIRLTTKKNEKVSILAAFFTRLKNEDEVEYAARFAVGRSTRKGSVDETQVGYSTLIGVLRDVTGVTQAELSKSYLEYGDLSESFAEFIGRKRDGTLFPGDEQRLTILEVASTFERITQAKGKGSASLKGDLVKSLLLRSKGSLEAKYIVKILSKEMRIGLVDGLVEEAVASAFQGENEERAQVKNAHLILGDIGLLAREAKAGNLDNVKIEPMRPTNFMLAEPMASAEEIARYFEGRELYAEYKYDGVRAQIHKLGDRVKIFSRRLEEITASFPEVVEEVSKSPHDFILDGEVVAFDDAKGPLSFQLIQRRLRRADVEESKRIAPVRYFCFDILYVDGRSVYGEPFHTRRSILWKVLEGMAAIRRAETTTVRTGKEIGEYFRKSRSLGYEGLVLKEASSPYTPGRRGKYWTKLKEELDTLDVVIVAAEFGHGKRAGKISDYTFAVRDGAGLRVIGKAYSGLTDKEIEEMGVRIKGLATGSGYRMDVRPEIVLEVAFDSVQKSERHDSGYALRFPRIKTIREDRLPSDIDTLERVREIYEAQKVKADAA